LGDVGVGAGVGSGSSFGSSFGSGFGSQSAGSFGFFLNEICTQRYWKIV